MVFAASVFVAGCRESSEDALFKRGSENEGEAGEVGSIQGVESASPLVGKDRLVPWVPAVADRVAALVGKSVYQVKPEEVSQIRVLNLNSAKLRSLRGFELFTGLEELSAKGGKISDLTPLSGLSKLRSLQLSDNEISDLAPLSQLDSLSLLELDNNEIESVQPLSSLGSLQQLFAKGNLIRDLAPLVNCQSMTHLSVTYNAIEEFPDLLPSPKL